MSSFLWHQLSAFPFTAPARGLQPHECHTTHTTSWHCCTVLILAIRLCVSSISQYLALASPNILHILCIYPIYSLKCILFSFLEHFLVILFCIFFSTSLLGQTLALCAESCFSIFPVPHLPSLPSNADRGHFPLLAYQETCCTSHSSLPSANDQEVRRTRLTVSEARKVPSVLCRLKILLVLLPAKLYIRSRATGVRKSAVSGRGRTRREQVTTRQKCK